MEQRPERSDGPASEKDPARGKDAVPGLRVSDQERDAALDVLAAALAEGRLDPHEHAERAEAALAARTAGELAALTADLPVPPPGRAEAAREQRAKGYAEWRHWLGGLVVLSAIWGVNCLHEGELAFYWPVTPLGIWAAALVARAIRPDRRKGDGAG
ncbi:DUF1707 domain-containing protein [Streptomyces griseus]|uniref:DUF1707 domain-containing protein n=1 Tax=Streptomyces griseus TaxID=1911 RepID=UPI000A44006B|nr:DUF1707 domain-containing protein [Streptomyces griseus]